MAEESGGGGGNDFGIGMILAFFGVVFVLWMASDGGSGGGIFGGNNASSTGFFGGNATTSLANDTEEETISALSSPESAPRTSREIESELYSADQELNRVKEDLHEAKLWGVISPFKEQVQLGVGSIRGEGVESEYLTLSASGGTTTVTLSGWSLESAVTKKRVRIPDGTRLARSSRGLAPITLEPYESGYVITGESPLGSSFHENACIGYLSEFQDFTPSLPSSCPYPRDEMKEFGNIALDDDSCYNAIDRVYSCRTVPDEILKSSLSASCRTFLENTLTYAGCVRNHEHDPYFFRGSWRMYLGESQKLWRDEREIIRLLDTEGKTVDVVEY